MWNMDSKYCSSPKFTSGFKTPDGQTEELLGMFFGSELLKIPCPCTCACTTGACVFPWKHADHTNNALVRGCVPANFGYGKGYICPKKTDTDGTAIGSIYWCDMSNEVCTVAEGYDHWSDPSLPYPEW